MSLIHIIYVVNILFDTFTNKFCDSGISTSTHRILQNFIYKIIDDNL